MYKENVASNILLGVIPQTLHLIHLHMCNFKTRRYINSFNLTQNPNAPEVFTNDNKALCTFQNLVPVNTPGKN